VTPREAWPSARFWSCVVSRDKTRRREAAVAPKVLIKWYGTDLTLGSFAA
jgi:hypothetical protein